MLIDTHAHVQFAKYKEDADEVMQRALDAGMVVVNVGSQIDTSKQAVDMLSKYPERVYAAVGLHPVHTWKHEFTDVDEIQDDFFTREESFDYDMYKKLAEHPKVVGIGECGLDYYRLPEVSVIPGLTRDLGTANLDYGSEAGMTHEEIKRRQKEAFLQQIKLAQELDKTLIIHCRPSSGTVDAYEDVLEILSKLLSFPRRRESIVPEHGTDRVSTGGSTMGPRMREDDKYLRFEVHCFTGPLSIAKKFIELGGYIGLNGIITFDKTGISEEVVKNIPLESIILETDAPYLTPAPHRGKRNEPVFVELVAKKIAEWKNFSFNEVAEVTTNNAKKLFKLA